MPRVEAWLADVQPDVLCMQETKLADAAFPTMAFSALGYESAHHGQGQWNGVAILSKVGLEDVVHGFADGGRSRRRRPPASPRPAAASGSRPSTCPTAARSGHDHYHYKLAWFGRLGAHLAAAGGRGRRSWSAATSTSPPRTATSGTRPFEGATHVTPPERRGCGDVEAWGLDDVFRRYHDDGRPVHLVGLPRRRLPPAPRHAHRPRAGHPSRSPSGSTGA